MEIVENQNLDKISDVINESPRDNFASEESGDKKEGGYFGYYIFVFISAIIGFILVFFTTRILVDETKKIGDINLVPHKMLIAVTVSLIAVIIFMFISMGLKRLLKKVFLSEAFLYVYIGFITTMISLISFDILNKNLNPTGTKDSLGWMVAEILAFVIAVTFAFFADKLVVFKSYSFIPTKIFAEFGLFISARLITEGINIIVMYVIINVMKQDAMLAKIISSVVVIVLNYLFSKFIIFKKKKIVVEVNDNEIRISEEEKNSAGNIENTKTESENND